MATTEKNFVDLIKGMRWYQEHREWIEDKLRKEWAKTGLFKSKEELEEEKEEALVSKDSLEVKIPKGFLSRKEKGKIREDRLSFLELAQESGAYDKKTGVIRKSWSDSLKAILDIIKERDPIIMEEDPIFKMFYESTATFGKIYEKYLEE